VSFTISRPRVSLLLRLASCFLLLSAIFSWSDPSAHASIVYPVGVFQNYEPSGMAPPVPGSFAGYNLTYVNDFNGHLMPPGWDLFSGHPGGLPAVSFSPSHVLVARGLLRIKTYRDPAFGNNWTMGGTCQCGRPVLYGAFFVRSRITGLGANSVELLWPNNNSWPPEIDFNENLNQLNLTTSTTHWGTVNHQQATFLHINMLHWHTWGVIWTPTYVLYVVDGHPWHQFATAGEIPQIPMNLDLETRAMCPSTFECPTQASAMLVDWVAEYQPS